MNFQQNAIGGKKAAPVKNFRKFGIFLGILILLTAGVFGFLEYRYQRILNLNNPGAEQLELFEIETGSTIGTISGKLAAENFILSARAFEKYAKRQNAAERFQAGRFYLAQNLTIPEVAEKLLNAERREEFFTIPEGLTLEEIDARITEKGYAAAGTFLNCVRETCDLSGFAFLPEDRAAWEGFFFPETYAVLPENFSAADLARKMLQEFERRAEDLGILEREDLLELVIMAAMVEEESREDDERAIISGILWKRLAEGIPLGVDATVRYFTGKQSEPLTIDDLSADNPYNTRNRLGLPPTAIANAGEASLRAAANPETSPYYYYLHGTDGEIYYAQTNDEHNLNKQRYL